MIVEWKEKAGGEKFPGKKERRKLEVEQIFFRFIFVRFVDSETEAFVSGSISGGRKK